MESTERTHFLEQILNELEMYFLPSAAATALMKSGIHKQQFV